MKIIIKKVMHDRNEIAIACVNDIESAKRELVDPMTNAYLMEDNGTLSRLAL